MAKNQHNAGLHYRPLNQLGLSNFNDYIENPIDSRFKFNPPPLKCGKLFGLCKADRQKEKLQKHCPWYPLLKMKAFTLEINGEAEYIWYCKTDFLLNIANKISTLDFFENLRCLRFFSERLLYQKAVQNKAICIPESKSQPLGLQAGTLVIAAEILEIAETTDEIALIIAVVVATSEQGLI